jgi:ureidoacrylate peracid hydrolase
MLARLERFLTSARQAQIPIIFVQTIRSPDTESSAWRQRRGYPDTVICQPASWGAELCIRPADHDIIVEKHRYSAFASGGLVDQLTAIGRQSLLFTGVSTSICVESTLREAVCRDYYCTVISDCCAEYDDDLHEQALRRVQSSFGLVTTSESVADIWTQQHHTEPAS